MDQESFEDKRRRTIELLNPEWLQEMRDVANELEMDFDEFITLLDEAVDDEHFYVNTGDRDIGSYQFDWNKIWAGYELLTMKKVPASRWRAPQVPFSCAC